MPRISDDYGRAILELNAAGTAYVGETLDGERIAVPRAVWERSRPQLGPRDGIGWFAWHNADAWHKFAREHPDLGIQVTARPWRVTVLGGSSDGGATSERRIAYTDAALCIGQGIGERGLTLVYGGTTTGPMWHAANQARLFGSRVIGVIPRQFHDGEWAALVDREARLEVTATFAERQVRMLALGDCIVALPGGIGTLFELMEAVAYAHLGLAQKPIVVLNTLGYYSPILEQLRRGQQERFVPGERQPIIVEADPEPTLARLDAILAARATATDA
jgi:uncharacterized protein (TIGR00730 family)